MDIEYYAQRLLNPFRGVVHVIRYRSAEAVTTDGIEWDLYVANDALRDGLESSGRRAQISDIRYGHWSAEKGLRRGPLYPSEDFRRLERMGAVVYEHLREAHRDVPFAFSDAFELWLLDRDACPLALLHSVRSEGETDTRPPLDWRAGIAAQERFRSTALPGPAGLAAASLTRAVNALSIGAAQWFHRTGDGSGIGLHVLKGDASLQGRTLAADVFPPLFIATGGMDAAHARLVRDYQAWQAPWLLLLPHLDPVTRAALETAAWQQGEQIEKHWRLYPAVIDRTALQATRVAAALERGRGAATAQDETMTGFYVELNSTGNS